MSLLFARRAFAVLLLNLGLAGCQPPAAAPSAPPEPTPLISKYYADLLGCSGVPGARVLSWDKALTPAAIGGPEPVLVVEPGRLRCSIPAYNMNAGSDDFEFWRASDVAEPEQQDGMSASSWTVQDGAIRGVTEASTLCRNAPYPLPVEGGACRFEIRWDAAAGRTAQTYTWDATATRPAFRRATLPAAIAAAKAIDCAEFSDSEDVIPPEAVNRIDIDRDGREDILMDYTNARCTVGGGPFLCGTGGCPVQVWMAGPDGALVKTIDEQLLRWRVPGAPGVIEASVHGVRCGLTGSDECVSTYTWNAATRAFDVRSEARPYTPG